MHISKGGIHEVFPDHFFGYQLQTLIFSRAEKIGFFLKFNFVFLPSYNIHKGVLV